MRNITIIIPTYNRADLIIRSVNSILNQSYDNFKIIIVDDCSTDNTKEIILPLTHTQQVLYYKTERNFGPATARNLGAQIADTEWIAFNDSDDVWHPDKLQKQIDYSLSRPECDLIYTGYRGIHHNGVITTTPDRDTISILEGDIYSSLLVRNSIGAPTILVRRDEYIKSGGFDKSYKCLEDWEFVIRFSKTHSIGFVDEDLVDAYISNTGISSQISEYYISRCKIVKSHLPELIRLNLFDTVVEDIFNKAANRGILPQVQSMLNTILNQ